MDCCRKYHFTNMHSGILSILSVLLGSLFSIGCLIGAFVYFRRKRLIDDLPTSKTWGVFIGLTELKGTAKTETPLTSYLTGKQCVQYAWHIEEHWMRTVVETYRDAQGHMQTRIRTESGWKKVAGDDQSIPFYLQDDTGIIRILPEKASIHGIRTFDETCSRDNPLYFGKGPSAEIANSTHRRRFEETAIPLDAMLYVLGQARERQDIIAAEIAYDKNAPMFMISTNTEKQISKSYGRWFWFWLVFGLILAVAGIVVQDIVIRFDSAARWQPYTVIIGGFFVIFGLSWLWIVYNSLVNLRHRVEQAWSQVDVQLKRRSDLIPNLIQVVEGYRSYERDVQSLLVALRGQAAITPEQSGVPEMKGFSPSLHAVVERYPELKANESFLKLQQALTDTEQRIALARDYFNEVVTFYNTRLEIIPDRFLATITGFHPRSLMSTAEFERAPVQVHFQS